MFDYKAWRIEKGLTQDEAGKLIGASQTTWSKLERGFEVAQAYQMAAQQLAGAEIERVVVEKVIQPQQSPIPEGFSGEDVRTELIDGQIWFHLGDVCNVIDYTKPSNALEHIENEDRQKIRVVNSGGKLSEVWFVSEPGLYQFLGNSNMPKAKPFKLWVTRVVLPSIRKTGSYNTKPETSLPDWAGQILQQNSLIMQQMGMNVTAMQRAQAEQQARLEQMQHTLATAPSQAADEVLARLQALDTIKGHLHNLVDAIVARARELPQNDPFAWQYNHHQRAWRAVHEWARPQVKSKSEYRTPEQVATAIRGAEMILSKLGAEIPASPVQLVMDLTGVAS